MEDHTIKIERPFVLEIAGTLPCGAGRVVRRVGFSVTSAELVMNDTPEALEAMLTEKLMDALLELGVAVRIVTNEPEPSERARPSAPTPRQRPRQSTR